MGYHTDIVIDVDVLAKKYKDAKKKIIMGYHTDIVIDVDVLARSIKTHIKNK
jgi:hypothetical protein